MIKEILIASAVLCPGVGDNSCIVSTPESASVDNKPFVQAITHWKKSKTKTIYIDKQQKR